jgi:carboxypeptidase family protein
MDRKVWVSMRPFLMAVLAVGSLSFAAGAAPIDPEKGFGRVTGTVLDTEGNPLMGATILVMGPLAPGMSGAEAGVERLVTDFRGEFVVGHLLPGWYSLRVSAPTRIPALRPDIHVEPGGTVREKFVLGDVFSSLRVQSPKTTSSTWGEDWKWILRTSASTRPVLRFQDSGVAANTAKDGDQALAASQRVFGMSPGISRGGTLHGDRGPGSILAYFRSLSEDSDVLVAGSMAADGSTASSLATAFRRNMKDDPQELALAVHQLSFADGIPLAGGDIQESLRSARVFMASYNNSRRLSASLTLTTGVEVDYLNAGLNAMSARPHAGLVYRLGGSDSDVVEIKYGTFNPASPGDLVDRIGVLTAYPQITMSGFHPQFENLNHTEAAYTHRFNKNSSLQVAAYRDSFYNLAVWGFGGVGAMEWLAASALPNPVADGWTLNAGNYTSSGMRVAYTRRIGNFMDAAVTYASGEALEAGTVTNLAERTASGLRDDLRPAPSQSVGGKLSARIPRSKTQVTTSYEWIGRNRITGIDPYGDAELEIEPFLDIQVRQPLPSLAFIPGRIEAMAEFGNPFMQGYVAVNHSADRMVLTPIYRSFRGGFSVQF